MEDSGILYIVVFYVVVQFSLILTDLDLDLDSPRTKKKANKHRLFILKILQAKL